MVSRVSEVELAQRLVQQQQARVVDQGACQRDALRHATGKLVRIGLVEAVEADEPKGLIDPADATSSGSLGLEAQRHVVPHRAPGEQRRILEDQDARAVRVR